VHLRKNRNVVEGREEGEHQSFSKQEKERVGDEFGQEDGEGIADGEPQGAERVVGLFAKEARLKHQGCGKEDGEPEETGAELAGLFGGRTDGKAEEDQDDEDEDHGGGEKLSGTKLGAKFLAEKRCGIGEEAHGRGQPPPKARMEWSEAPELVSATTEPPSSRTARVARAEISDSPWRLITTVHPAR